MTSEDQSSVNFLSHDGYSLYNVRTCSPEKNRISSETESWQFEERKKTSPPDSDRIKRAVSHHYLKAKMMTKIEHMLQIILVERVLTSSSRIDNFMLESVIPVAVFIV